MLHSGADTSGPTGLAALRAEPRHRARTGSGGHHGDRGGMLVRDLIPEIIRDSARSADVRYQGMMSLHNGCGPSAMLPVLM
jgi:hypothetical protein